MYSRISLNPNRNTTLWSNKGKSLSLTVIISVRADWILETPTCNTHIQINIIKLEQQKWSSVSKMVQKLFILFVHYILFFFFKVDSIEWTNTGEFDKKQRSLASLKPGMSCWHACHRSARHHSVRVTITCVPVNNECFGVKIHLLYAVNDTLKCDMFLSVRRRRHRNY